MNILSWIVFQPQHSNVHVQIRVSKWSGSGKHGHEFVESTKTLAYCFYNSVDGYGCIILDHHPEKEMRRVCCELSLDRFRKLLKFQTKLVYLGSHWKHSNRSTVKFSRFELFRDEGTGTLKFKGKIPSCVQYIEGRFFRRESTPVQ